MARTLWPNADPVSQCIILSDDGFCATVVGVAEDAARNGFADDLFMAYYVPPHLAPDEPLRGLYVRSTTSAEAILDEVSTLLRGFSSEVRYARVTPLRAMLDPQAQSWRLGAIMFTIFGALALVLAAIGLYSVLAFDVAQRTRELGVRTALGAQRGRLLGAVLVRGLGMGSLGVALGLAVAYLAAPYAQDLLFEVSPRDPLILALVGGALLVVGAAASLVPGLRATRVDPLTALKAD
jgi:ABC-type antimicrobial peptide transport system permease subunit